jgi:transposase
LFAEDSFYDPHDLVQVKYEMLRRVQSEGHSVTDAAAAFGFSRPSFYQALSSFEGDGLAGLVPHKRGPKQAHNLTDEVLSFLVEIRQNEPSVRTPELVRRIQERFGTKVHSRSIERALLYTPKNAAERIVRTTSIHSGCDRAVRAATARGDLWLARGKRRIGASVVSPTWNGGLDAGLVTNARIKWRRMHFPRQSHSSRNASDQLGARHTLARQTSHCYG